MTLRQLFSTIITMQCSISNLHLSMTALEFRLVENSFLSSDLDISCSFPVLFLIQCNVEFAICIPEMLYTLFRVSIGFLARSS